MPQITACPTLPEILRALRSDASLDAIQELVQHLVTCPVCTDTLARLNIAQSVIERLHTLQTPAGSADQARIDSLILTLRAAANPELSTTHGEQTVIGPAETQPAGDDDWTSLLTPPVNPNELGQLGGYRVLRIIGTGGMGVVFEAEDPDLHRRVALKVPNRAPMRDAAARERFLREARTAAALRDEHIVTIYQVGQVRELPFLAMELLTGEPLDARLRREGRLPVAEVLRIGREMAEGLAVAHDQGLIHRDIKPANIWLATRPASQHSGTTADSRVKILDFGLARPTESDANLTATGQIIGTPHYMAPEQARGDAVDSRSDLFSLGCVLYEMAVGTQAFSGSSTIAVLTALATITPRAPIELRGDLPLALSDLINRLLSKDLNQRPATAWDVVESLRAIEHSQAAATVVTMPRAALSSAGLASPNRRRMLLTAAALLPLGAIGAAWWLKPWERANNVGGAAAGPALASGPPIRVGVLHSRTGTMAQSERPVIDATLLAIEEVNEAGGILGRPVEAVIEDGESDGSVFARKSEKLITQDQVAVVFGCWTSASRKAVRLVFEKHDHLLMYPVQYEGLEQSPNIFYLGAAPNQQIIPAVTWCCSFLKKRRLFLVGSDYVFPRAAHAIIRDQADSLGAEIVGEEYLLLGSTDVQAVIQKIVASDAEVILNTINGDTNLAFIRGLRAAGVTAAMKPMISFSLSEEELSSFSPRDVAGDYAAWNYFQSIDEPQNHAFVERFQKRYGTTRVLSDPMEAAYVGVHLWAQAAREAKSDEPQAVRAALKTQSYDAPEGTIRIHGETQHAEKHVRIGQITEDGRFAVVYCSEQPIVPVPYPRTRSREEWDALLNDLHLRWGGQWANPGR